MSIVYVRSRLPEAGPDAMPRRAIPTAGALLCSGMGDNGEKCSGSQSTLHLPKYSEDFKATPFTVFSGVQQLSMVVGEDEW